MTHDPRGDSWTSGRAVLVATLLLALVGSAACSGDGTTKPGAPDDGAPDSTQPVDSTDDSSADGITDTAASAGDTDKDGVDDVDDNCPFVANELQTDTDLDGEGDACDEDDDGDWVLDGHDNCPLDANVGQADADDDGTGDACEDDDDDDGVPDALDNCPTDANPDQYDSDNDGVGDACSVDSDGDGVLDAFDNCVLDSNVDQLDTDEDGAGNACDNDDDDDGVTEPTDNCPLVKNPDQEDLDKDGLGDACDDVDNLWLLSIDNETHELLKVDVITGKGTAVCTLNTTDKYPSTTFGRTGNLYASNNTEDRLDLIDPCDCTITPIGSYGFSSSIVGITTDQAQGLFGVDMLGDALVAIDTLTGQATEIGPLGFNIGASGATWSDDIKALYAIDGYNASLHIINPTTGMATKQADLSETFNYVGIELHPANNQIYACTGSTLMTVEPASGTVTIVGEISANECNNLAAPYTVVSCPQWPEG